MADLSERVGDVAAVEVGPGRVALPVWELPTFDAPDLVEAERATAEPLSPEDFEPIELDEAKPVGERIVDAMKQLWDQMEFADVVAAAALNLQYQQTMNELLVNGQKRSEYLTELGMAYSNYVMDSLEGYVDLLKMAGKALQRAFECNVAAFEFSTAVFLGAVQGEIDFAGLLAELAGECPELYTIVLGLSELHAWFETLRDHPIDVALAIAELLGEIIVAVLEAARDKEIIATLAEYAADHRAIGQIHGILIGIVIADIVIDELLTLGAGKVLKGARWVVQAAP